MENYNLIKKLGKGAQGSVFLCEDKVTHNKYVMKKVECSDESEANKAFKEATALEQLSHQYICGYKEFFVSWDKLEETMYVCIVMEYYETGDLENVLKQQRAKETPLPEQILKKWFGQMVEALAFVHGKKVIHRDLKPSNIFMTKNLDISLGDFGVATVMNDARTRTRTTVGTMNWMAPEVLERPYDERSDVWSLGCIVLDAATCGFFDSAQSLAALFEIKHSSPKLEEVLKEVNKSYSKELCQVIRAMLRRNFKQRPTALDLVKLPFVRSCLELSHSKLVDGVKRAAAAEGQGKPTTTKRVPDTLAEMVPFLRANLDRVGCQVAALEAAVPLIANKAVAVPEGLLGAIMAARAAHAENSYAQIAVCQALRALIPRVGDDDALYSKESVEAILDSMRAHPAARDLQKEACDLIWALAINDECATRIGELGGVQDILAALREGVEDAAIAEACCGALWSLCVLESNMRIMTEEQGIHDIAQAMRTHGASATLVESACAALFSLCSADENVDLMFDLGCVGMIVKALATHKTHPKLVKQACLALSGLVVEEDCAFSLVNNDEEVEGISAILNAVKANQADADVVENAAVLLGEIAEHADLKEMLLEKGARELLTSLKNSFAAKKSVADACADAISILVDA
eukprot:m.233895 g.233895  ORF g.233895 m.233895 type:complete len:638 (-) comp19339_c0_seq1:78-1991(-)